MLLLAMGAGGVWASRLRALEPYRPVFVALALVLIVLALFSAYRARGARACPPGESCRLPASRPLSRTPLWIVTTMLVALVAAPYLARQVHAHLLKCGAAPGGSASAGADGCCAVPAAAESEPRAENPQNQTPAPIDPAREVVFEVQSLQCPAVKGVGCGSMLWPVLTAIDRVDGVKGSFSNWTGTRLRVSVAADADRNAVAERVRRLLASDGHHPTHLTGTDFTKALDHEQWHSAAGLVELSSYEFRTIAKRRLRAFADGQKLDAGQRDKLMNLVDRVWDRSAEGLELSSSEEGAYRQYWRARLNRFVGAFAERARDVLGAEQVKHLLRQYQPPS